MDRSTLLARARERGANPFVYWPVRAMLEPFFRVYFRMRLLGREHVPQSGPLIIASNHRSFLDPFVVGLLVRRPVYFVAKRELFRFRAVAWLLNALGAFPIDRGKADADAMSTARAILERGDVVVIFPEGTRVRPGPLGRPKRGVGRLALETGAPVVPVAVAGSEDVRRGWRIRPHRVTVRAGRPLTFPRVERPSPHLAGAVTDRIWPCVALQWEWLGGVAPVRRAAVIGDGDWAHALTAALARAGVETERAAPRARALDLDERDLVVFALPSTEIPGAVAAHAARIPRAAGVLVLGQGLVPPTGTLPSAYIAERTHARAVGVLAGPARPEDVAAGGGSVVVASLDRAFARQAAQVLREAGLDVTRSADVVGVELAACAADAAALAAAIAAARGAGAAGAAAGKVLDEAATFARSRGADPATFAGPAGAGRLAAAIREHDDEHPSSDPATVALLARALHDARVPAPATEGLAALVEGRLPAERWLGELAAPRNVA